jgi:hypothetical protein
MYVLIGSTLLWASVDPNRTVNVTTTYGGHSVTQTVGPSPTPALVPTGTSPRPVVVAAGASTAFPWLGLSLDPNLHVTSLDTGMPAVEAGVQTGDVLTGVNDRTSDKTPPATLMAALRGAAGEAVDLDLTHNGQPYHVRLVHRSHR